MDLPRFCVFCGRPPKEKNREHVLPMWLIGLTGDPKRVVNFGVNPLTGKQPRFNWSNFVFPSCTSCNERYAELEGAVKPIVERLIQRRAVDGYEFIRLLDWLDKVRIGLWLGYLYIHRNPADISPRFHIESRIGLKDRMAAIYFIETKRKGLGAYAAETLCFQIFPCCFSLNINNVHILNMSWDFMCAAACGFPFPRKMIIDLDTQGMLLECSDYKRARKRKWPISVRPIIKPVIHIYQPAVEVPAGDLATLVDDSWLRSNLLPGSDRQGLPVRQYDARVEVLDDLATPIQFDEVTGKHCRPLKDIIAQTYDLQMVPTKATVYRSSNAEALSNIRRMLRLARHANGRAKNAFAGIKQKEFESKLSPP